jgi:sortase A
MKKIIAVCLILIGIMVMLYPKITHVYSNHQQNKLLEEWGDNRKSSLVQDYQSLNEVLADTPTESPQLPTENEQEFTDNMVGILKISKINLELPILEGATQKNLKIAAGHLEGTALPGEIGNSAIAAHRSRAQGRMFNRLNELKAGDEIIVTDRNQTFRYEVDSVSVVEPTDLSVLNADGENQILTLITCEPITTATHRLIVRAKLQKQL